MTRPAEHGCEQPRLRRDVRPGMLRPTSATVDGLQLTLLAQLEARRFNGSSSGGSTEYIGHDAMLPEGNLTMVNALGMVLVGGRERAAASLT